MARNREAVKINLLPPEVQPYRPFLSHPKRKMVAAVSLAAVVLLLYFFLLGHIWVSVKRLELVKNQLVFYRSQEEEAHKAEQRINSLRQQKAELERLVQNRQKWSDLLLALSAALPREVWITKLESTSNKEILFTGRTYSLGAVSDFLAALESLSFLKEVKLQSIQAAAEDKAILEFSIRALLEKP